jgi:hypothetical protein
MSILRCVCALDVCHEAAFRILISAWLARLTRDSRDLTWLAQFDKRDTRDVGVTDVILAWRQRVVFDHPSDHLNFIPLRWRDLSICYCLQPFHWLVVPCSYFVLLVARSRIRPVISFCNRDRIRPMRALSSSLDLLRETNQNLVSADLMLLSYLESDQLEVGIVSFIFMDSWLSLSSICNIIV